MNEAYLHNKIREQQETISQLKEEIEEIKNKIKIIEIPKKIITEAFEEERKLRKSDLNEVLIKGIEHGKNNIIEIKKYVKRDIQHIFNQHNEFINNTINDHFTNHYLLLKYLEFKGNINPSEFEKFTYKYHDIFKNEITNNSSKAITKIDLSIKD